MKKIKVLQVIHSLNYGGAEQVVVDLVENTNKQIFEVEVCCINFAGPYADHLRENGYKIHQIQESQCSISIYELFHRLYKLINALKPDVIHTHGDIALCDLGPICMVKRIPPVIHTFHFGNYPNMPKRYIFSQAVFGRFVKQLVCVASHQAKAVSKYMYLPLNKIKIIHNGVTKLRVDEEKVKIIYDELGLAEKDFVVGCIAVLTEQKGIPYLLQAAQQLCSKHDNLRFVIVGGGHLENTLRQQAQDLGVGDKVIFTGWKKNAREYLEIFDVFVSPSLWEAFSIVILEAMAAKKAMIVTDVSDNTNVIKHGETGIVVQSGDAEKLAEAISHFIKQQTLVREFGDKVYEDFCARFSVSTMVKNYETEYLRLSGHVSPK